MMEESATAGANAENHDAPCDESAPRHDFRAESLRLRRLRDSLARAWTRASASFSRSPTAEREPPRPMESVGDPGEAFDSSLNATLDDFSTLGMQVAEDALALAKEWGVSVSDLVRRHPVRAVIIAGLAGAAVGFALRAQRKPDEHP